MGGGSGGSGSGGRSGGGGGGGTPSPESYKIVNEELISKDFGKKVTLMQAENGQWAYTEAMISRGNIVRVTGMNLGPHKSGFENTPWFKTKAEAKEAAMKDRWI